MTTTRQLKVGTVGEGQNTPTVSLRVVRCELKGVPMAARLRHGTTPVSCVKSTGMPAQNAATILETFLPILTQPLLHMEQHVADWVAFFPRSQHSFLFSSHWLELQVQRSEKKLKKGVNNMSLFLQTITKQIIYLFYHGK